MTVADVTVLRIERTFDAPAEDVFDAWTNPEVLRRWWNPYPDGRVPVAEVDARVGGAYRIGMESPDGTAHTELQRAIGVATLTRVEAGGLPAADVTTCLQRHREPSSRACTRTCPGAGSARGWLRPEQPATTNSPWSP